MKKADKILSKRAPWMTLIQMNSQYFEMYLNSGGTRFINFQAKWWLMEVRKYIDNGTGQDARHTFWNWSIRHLFWKNYEVRHVFNEKIKGHEYFCMLQKMWGGDIFIDEITGAETFSLRFCSQFLIVKVFWIFRCWYILVDQWKIPPNRKYLENM